MTSEFRHDCTPGRFRPTHHALALGVFVLSVAFCGGGRAHADDDPQPTAAEKAAGAFVGMDRDKDQHVSLKEYLANRAGSIPVATRDFRMVDFDADGLLDSDEFSTLPTVVPAAHRGRMPDPVLSLVDHAIAAMDQSFEGWDKKPDLEIDVNQFVAAFSSTLGLKVRPNSREADENGDRRVSREEARRFMEIQMGVRRGDGKPLREPGGRVCNLMLYHHIDLNANDRLERDEFVERSYLPDTAVEVFEQGDVNNDDALSFDEWVGLPRRGFDDPVMEFRHLDANLDARVDPKELAERTSDWKKNMSANVFPGFDMDGDGALSLTEYRLTMQANPIARWQNVPRDTDGDDQLAFAEFQFDSPRFPLLRWIYFQRLDLDGSQTLEPNEYAFTTRPHNEFFVLNSDGTGWRHLFKLDGYPGCGSPDVSPDGTQIAFDAWAMKPRRASALFIADVDGGNPRKLRTGMMPNWSKDGRLLACSTSGVRIVGLDGSDQQLINRSGWGAQWSPDGKSIAFNLGTAIQSYDVASKQTTTIIDGEAHPYNRFYWNMKWSPDSKRLCFKGTKADGTSDVVTVNMRADKPQLKVHHSTKESFSPSFAWHPDGDRIVLPMRSPERARVQLYEFNPNKNEPPKLVVGQDKSRSNVSMCWTPDGKRLIVVSGGF